MNLSKIYRKGYGSFITKFRQAHAAVGSSVSEIESLPKQEPKVTKHLAGYSLVSAENYSPVTHIVALVKAGSRNETAHNLGITHCLRNCALLSSKNNTSFAMVRHVEQHGSKVTVASTREFMIYSVHCIRDHVDQVMPVLAEIIGQQSFKPWEVSDANPRMNIDLALFKDDPDARLMEALHKVAFRGGLDVSLYSPEFMIGKHTPDMLHEYVQNCYTAHRTTVAGLGITHDHLDNLVGKFFDMKVLSDWKDSPSKFAGGEMRIDADLPFTRAVIVAEGASLTSVKEMLSLGVLQCILGVGSQIPYSTAPYSKIGAAAAKATSHPFAAASLNFNYLDTGMFGVYLAGHPDDMKDIVKSVITQMRETTKKLSDAEVQSGKHALKAKLLMEQSEGSDLAHTMGCQVASTNRLQTASELQKAIDALTTTDVNAVASKVMKVKPAMAAMGPLHNTPYLDELL